MSMYIRCEFEPQHDRTEHEVLRFGFGSQQGGEAFEKRQLVCVCVCVQGRSKQRPKSYRILDTAQLERAGFLVFADLD